MKNTGINMVMNMIAGVDRTLVKPTAIRRQPEAVSFVRKTARREVVYRFPHGKPYRKGRKEPHQRPLRGVSFLSR